MILGLKRSSDFVVKLAALGFAISLAGGSARAAETASATVSFTQVSSTTYHYTLTLNNIGTTNLGTFWFAWIPGQDFMPTQPTNLASPSAWVPTITGGTPGDGYAVLWQAGSGAALTPGKSLAGFAFDSTTTPAQMAGPSQFFQHLPVTTSFVYVGAAFSDAGYQFVASIGADFLAVTPCRVADTRNPNGPFGGPVMGANTSREFVIPKSSCGIPSDAVAYSLNVTVVPTKALGFLTIWPAGQPRPSVSTLNSDGRVKANAVIVPAGDSGGVSVFVTDSTQVILDIDGYFVRAGSDSAGLTFHPLTPCRVADTRNATGPLGGPPLSGGAAGRAFPILSSNCGIPGTAEAYSLNFTAVPPGPLAFVTVWPTGQSQPGVSTLNASTGQITANAAIVPAGKSGEISVFASNNTNLIIDVNGYFSSTEKNGLVLYTLAPCRVLDTRNPPGAPTFSGTKTVNVSGSGCAAPASAQAFVMNATVVPPGKLLFLTLWPNGEPQPATSTLNAVDGAITSNMAIVPTKNGSIDAFASDPTHLILDIASYFAP